VTLREEIIPASLGGVTGTEVAVGGQVGRGVDFDVRVAAKHGTGNPKTRSEPRVRMTAETPGELARCVVSQLTTRRRSVV
jgi:hypothetical protein